MANYVGTEYGVQRIPYDERKGSTLWPDGARLAFMFYTCPEEWEWELNEPQGVNGAYSVRGEKQPSLSTQTAVGFGFNVGLKRLRDVALSVDMPMTLATTGNAAERHADLVAELAGNGFAVAAHGWSEGVPQNVIPTRSEQSDDIDRSVEILTKVTGVKPLGWWGPGATCNNDTVELLAEKGFLFHGDLQDDELPYIIEWAGNRMVEIPYNMVNNMNDYNVFVGARRPLDQSLDYFRSTFDAYYRQAGETPLQLILGTHPFVSGRAESAYVIAKFLEYVRGFDDVWCATHEDVAKWWIESNPKTD